MISCDLFVRSANILWHPEIGPVCAKFLLRVDGLLNHKYVDLWCLYDIKKIIYLRRFQVLYGVKEKCKAMSDYSQTIDSVVHRIKM